MSADAAQLIAEDWITENVIGRVAFQNTTEGYELRDRFDIITYYDGGEWAAMLIDHHGEMIPPVVNYKLIVGPQNLISLKEI